MLLSRGLILLNVCSDHHKCDELLNLYKITTIQELKKLVIFFIQKQLFVLLHQSLENPFFSRPSIRESSSKRCLIGIGNLFIGGDKKP